MKTTFSSIFLSLTLGIAVLIIAGYVTSRADVAPAKVAPSFQLVPIADQVWKFDTITGRAWHYHQMPVQYGTNTVQIEGWVEVGNWDESEKQAKELLGRSR